VARTMILAHPLPGTYPALPLAPASVDLIFTATDDPVSRECALVDNKTVVLAYNTDTGPQTITFVSVEDPNHRTGDITAYSVDPGLVSAFGPFRSTGWSYGGKLQFDVSDAKLRLSVITLP
jgi:hypothetical protein